MKLTEEIEFVTPGFRRKQDSIHQGFWTPKLARWSDKNGFEQGTRLQSFTYTSGAKVTGAEVNASPVIAILESEMAERDLTFEITGTTGIASGAVTYDGETLTGYTKDHQYGKDILRRQWVTGIDKSYSTTVNNYKTSINLNAHEFPGNTILLGNKKIYEINDVNVYISGTQQVARREDQPLIDVGFYAMADAGSKLLYTFNWDKMFRNALHMLHGRYAAPKKCPTCLGSGTVGGGRCDQCEGYKFSGYNSSGYMLDKLAEEVGIKQESGESLARYQDRIWSKKWIIIPTKNEIQRYFSHFSSLEDEEIEITNNFRDNSTSGIESIVDIQLPYVLPVTSRFDSDDSHWNTMVRHIEPAGIDIRFSFVATSGLTGATTAEEAVSASFPYYSGGIEYNTGILAIEYDASYTGYLKDPHQYGFYRPFGPVSMRGWYATWGEPWLYFGGTGNKSRGVLGSGYEMNSGITYTWESGELKNDQFIKWVMPAETLPVDNGGIDQWVTGGSSEVDQDLLWESGTFYWDNFWASGDGIDNIY